MKHILRDVDDLHFLTAFTLELTDRSEHPTNTARKRMKL
jgi:hypothetical protein